jgi:bacterioferritin
LASQKLLELLNKGIARELQVSIQYMWQHVQVTGIDGAVVKSTFKEIAIAEMKHAEALAERLDYLDGVPTTKPDPVFVGGSLI